MIYYEKKIITVSDAGWIDSATWAGNTKHSIVAGRLNQILIKPDTATTTYKFKLTDSNDRVVFDTLDYVEGTMNRTMIDLLIKGVYTMTIYSSSLKEGFDIMMAVKEY